MYIYTHRYIYTHIHIILTKMASGFKQVKDWFWSFCENTGNSQHTETKNTLKDRINMGDFDYIISNLP